ncbi:MAG: MoaD/ThiS family protein [Salinibacter sp.]
MAPSPDSPSPPDATDVRAVQVQYYAQLREEAGRDAETVRTEAPSVSALYEELNRQHGFSLPSDRLRVAVNGSFVDWDTALAPQDLVVFIPPVAGG